ncbi:MAG: PAS domain S-box protein [Candidatus Abyssobacteria bacterium SURF_17]|uniref:histidine kinase n=1 Tax=Candidatus Abyssobacteria bacterium SURF_17 TaxID=2093361 RepID=A0A419EPN2_9BACT|nr:MAG: PAS domain S-box protein [Candidatus Abyssubacteria bacterium SURF_17]
MVETEWQRWLHSQLFEQVPCCIAVIDRQYNIVENNRAFRDVFGEGKGKKCYEIYKGRKDRCPDCMAAHTFADGRPRVNDEVGIDHRGRKANYLVHVSPVIAPDGSVPYVVELSTDVTETKRLQKEYQILFERVPCFVMVLNRDLRVVRANERVREVFGECVGEHCYKILKHRWEKCEDCPAERTFADGQSHSSKHEGTNKHGEKTHYVVNTSPLLTGNHHVAHVIEMALDLTETHRLENELAKEHFLREILIENSMDGVIATQPDGEVLIFNPAAERLLKYRAEDLLKKQPPDTLFPSEFLALKESGKDVCVLPETTMAARDGEKIPVRFTGVALKQGDEFIGSAAFLQDLREIKQLEREKIEAERFAAVGQTVAGLAHGIKNLVTGLEGAMYVFNTGLKKGEQSRIDQGWEMLNRNIEKVSALAKNLLAFSKGRTLKVEWTDPNELVREVVALFHDAARQNGIDLAAELQENIEPAPMEPQGIHECLTNLVSNAIDACKTSDKPRCSIVVRSREEGGSLILEVEDSGCGMDSETRQRIFTNFFTTKGAGGTGLGLLITRRIVQEHGGTISFESIFGKGSLFRIVFPRHLLPQPPEA